MHLSSFDGYTADPLSNKHSPISPNISLITKAGMVNIVGLFNYSPIALVNSKLLTGLGEVKLNIPLWLLLLIRNLNTLIASSICT